MYLSPERVHSPRKVARDCSRLFQYMMRAGRPAHLQLAHLAAASTTRAVVVDDAHVVARHRLAGGAVFHVARAVRQEDVQHLGRAEPVEDVDAVALRPAPADLRRQRLAGGDAAAQLQLCALRRGRACEERRIERRHRVEARHLMLSSGSPRRRRASAGPAAARWWRRPKAGTSSRCRARRRRTASPPNSRRRSR